MAKAFVSGLFSALAGMYYHGVPACHPHHTLGPRHTHSIPTHIISWTIQLLNFVNPVQHRSQVKVVVQCCGIGPATCTHAHTCV